MPEYALTEFWVYLGFLIWKDSEYGMGSEYVSYNTLREVLLQVNEYLSRDGRIQKLIKDLP